MGHYPLVLNINIKDPSLQYEPQVCWVRSLLPAAPATISISVVATCWFIHYAVRNISNHFVFSYHFPESTYNSPVLRDSE